MGPAPSGEFRPKRDRRGAAQRIRWRSACLASSAGRCSHYPAVGVPGSQADGADHGDGHRGHG
eukprot:6005703-Heterocapsa_arctica.AAC.1